VFVLWAGRETVFRGDDWDLFLYRGGFNADVFFVPHNEHLSALLVVAFKTIPAIAGPHYGAFRLALVALDVVMATLFFVFARERVGDWLALLATAPLLLMGAGADNLLWPTQIGVVGSLVCGLGVLILLDRSGFSAKAAACALLIGSIFFSSDGLFFLAAAGIWLLLSRDRRRDLWIVAVPALAYLAWYQQYGSSEFTAGNLRASPRFILDLATGGVSALTGIGSEVGHPHVFGAIVAIGGLVALGALVVKTRPRPTPRLAAIVALPILSWAIIALGRADGGDPFASRYVYASALFVLMAVLEIARGDYVQRVFRGWSLAVPALAVAVAMLFGAKSLTQDGDYWRSVSQYIHGRTAAIELTRRTISPNLLLQPLPDMAHMTAGWYLNAVNKYGGSPTGRPDIAGLSEQGRSAADQVLATGAPVQLVQPPADSGPVGPPPQLDSDSTKPVTRGSCLVVRPETPVSVTVPPSGILILPRRGASVSLRLRRFASAYEQAPHYTVSSPTLLGIAVDHSSAPWHAHVSSRGQVALCGSAISPRMRRGPTRPASGNQHCSPASLGEDECRFNRY
jgi:hypothetical protein